jgi:hypothetical protein
MLDYHESPQVELSKPAPLALSPQVELSKPAPLALSQPKWYVEFSTLIHSAAECQIGKRKP